MRSVVGIKETWLPSGYEFSWAWGPPLGMKVVYQGSLIPNWLSAIFEGVQSMLEQHSF